MTDGWEAGKEWSEVLFVLFKADIILYFTRPLPMTKSECDLA